MSTFILQPVWQPRVRFLAALFACAASSLLPAGRCPRPRTPCICSFGAGSGRGLSPRSPCMCSSGAGAGRWSRPRPPCPPHPLLWQVRAEVRAPALVTLAPSALVRADAPAPVLLALAPLALLRTDARGPALLASVLSSLARAESVVAATVLHVMWGQPPGM
jgi:hypothetical protein